MTIRTIFKQLIGGATEKKGRREWANDGRSAGNLSKHLRQQPLSWPKCVGSVPLSLGTHQFGWEALPKNG